MSEIFPKIIVNLNDEDDPLDSAKAYLSQSNNNQGIFLEFEKDVILPDHSH